MDAPETRYVRTPRGHLAYQVTGSGDRTIFYMTGTGSHVELRWEIPHLVRLHRRLMTLGRVVSLDPLGLGASDPLPEPVPTLDDAADDYVSVLDAVGAERVVIVATQHGVAPALVIAAKHPDRVEQLVFLGGYARLLAAPDFPEGVDPALIDLFLEMYMPIWGTGAFFARTYGIEADEGQLASLARLERISAAPGAIERLLRWITASDVRNRLADVRAPALVFGITTPLVSAEVTAAMVAGLADVRFVDVGHDPVATGEGLDELMAEVAEFVTGSRAVAQADRRLAAVLFTDIVGSTEQAAAIGDDQWRDRLDSFRFEVRREVERHGGREVNTRGDDFLVVFERASNAIECARGLRTAVGSMGLGVRTGIHVGEVEVDGDDLTGVAVHVGARVAAMAHADEILVTTAAREAVAGMAWAFTDRDTHELKGVPGGWHLWRVDP
jgi:class 3 adenylate cyclase